MKPIPTEITNYLLAKEFGWTPSQVRAERAIDIKGILHVLSTVNLVKNQEIAKENKKKKGR